MNWDAELLSSPTLAMRSRATLPEQSVNGSPIAFWEHQGMIGNAPLAVDTMLKSNLEKSSNARGFPEGGAM
jgi:hypothetical protein